MLTLLYWQNVTFFSFDIENLWLRKYKMLRILWFRYMSVQPSEENYVSSVAQYWIVTSQFANWSSMVKREFEWVIRPHPQRNVVFPTLASPPSWSNGTPPIVGERGFLPSLDSDFSPRISVAHYLDGKILLFVKNLFCQLLLIQTGIDQVICRCVDIRVRWEATISRINYY